MFIRRIYYDRTSGEFLYGYSVHTNYVLPILSIEDLFPDRNAKEIGIMEWLEPDESVEQYFNDNYDVSVNVSVEPHELVFTERPEPEPSDVATVEDYEKALSELGV